MPSMKPEIAKRWVDELRSGKYKQGKHRLATALSDGTVEYCCLGVLCELAVADGVISNSKTFEGLAQKVYGQDGVAVPPREVVEWAFEDVDATLGDYSQQEGQLWAVNYTGNNVETYGHQDPTKAWLPELNDVFDVDFDEIADLIEDTHVKGRVAV